MTKVDPDVSKNKKKMSTKEKRKEALEKKAAENTGTVVADISDDNGDEGSRREMLSGNNDPVRAESPVTSSKKNIGNSRFKSGQEVQDDLPADGEEGGGFF